MEVRGDSGMCKMGAVAQPGQGRCVYIMASTHQQWADIFPRPATVPSTMNKDDFSHTSFPFVGSCGPPLVELWCSYRNTIYLSVVYWDNATIPPMTYGLPQEVSNLPGAFGDGGGWVTRVPALSEVRSSGAGFRQ